MLVCISYIVLCQLWILIFCVILAVEKCSSSTTLKTQKPAFIYIMKEAVHKPLHSALLHICFIHLQWNESQWWENNPLRCGRRWPHLQDLMLKNNRKYRKGRQKYLYVESNHSERFVDWRKSFCSQQRTTLLEEILSEFRRDFITWAIVHSAWRI